MVGADGGGRTRFQNFANLRKNTVLPRILWGILHYQENHPYEDKRSFTRKTSQELSGNHKPKPTFPTAAIFHQPMMFFKGYQFVESPLLSPIPPPPCQKPTFGQRSGAANKSSAQTADVPTPPTPAPSSSQA
jgi:hypothetical protein